MRVVQQGEAFAVQSQKSENGQMMKCNIVLQEMGGKYENQYAAAMLGNMAQCKYAPGELVAVTLRFTTHEHNGQVYQDFQFGHSLLCGGKAYPLFLNLCCLLAGLRFLYHSDKLGSVMLRILGNGFEHFGNKGTVPHPH